MKMRHRNEIEIEWKSLLIGAGIIFWSLIHKKNYLWFPEKPEGDWTCGHKWCRDWNCDGT